jgi:hypothetical protein
MNADATPSVAVDGRFALTIPHLFASGSAFSSWASSSSRTA